MTKQVIVLGTDARGGIRSVIDAYEKAGFYRNFRVYRVVTHSEGHLVFRLFLAAKAFLVVSVLLSTRRIDLVHMHMSMRGSFWRKYMFMAMANWAGVPALVHLHGSEFAEFYERSSTTVQKCVRRLFGRASAVVVLSSAWHDFVRRLTECPVDIVSNFVPDNFDEVAINEKRKWRNLVFLGQFGVRKGIFDLVPTITRVAAHYKNTYLTCAGNGEVDAVRQLVMEVGADNCIAVPGWVDGNDKIELLVENGIFILPSYNEGLPMAIIEAMSMAMPIISTSVGGIAELVGSDNGVLIIPGAHDELEAAITKLVTQSEESLKIMGGRSRQIYLERFSPEACLGKMQSVYERIGVWE